MCLAVRIISGMYDHTLNFNHVYSFLISSRQIARCTQSEVDYLYSLLYTVVAFSSSATELMLLFRKGCIWNIRVYVNRACTNNYIDTVKSFSYLEMTRAKLTNTPGGNSTWHFYCATQVDKILLTYATILHATTSKHPNTYSFWAGMFAWESIVQSCQKQAAR